MFGGVSDNASDAVGVDGNVLVLTGAEGVSVGCKSSPRTTTVSMSTVCIL